MFMHVALLLSTGSRFSVAHSRISGSLSLGISLATLGSNSDRRHSAFIFDRATPLDQGTRDTI